MQLEELTALFLCVSSRNKILNNPGFYITEKIGLFENIVEKRENAGNQEFLLLAKSFLSFSVKISFFSCLQYKSL